MNLFQVKYFKLSNPNFFLIFWNIPPLISSNRDIYLELVNLRRFWGEVSPFGSLWGASLSLSVVGVGWQSSLLSPCFAAVIRVCEGYLVWPADVLFISFLLDCLSATHGTFLLVSWLVCLYVVVSFVISHYVQRVTRPPKIMLNKERIIEILRTSFPKVCFAWNRTHVC